MVPEKRDVNRNNSQLNRFKRLRELKKNVTAKPRNVTVGYDYNGGPTLQRNNFIRGNVIRGMTVNGKSQKDHDELLREIFRRIQVAGLKINPEKCKFNKTELFPWSHS